MNEPTVPGGALPEIINEVTPALMERAIADPTSFFSSIERFEMGQRIAKMLSQSKIIPTNYQGNIPDIMIALEMAGRIGVSAVVVMQNLHVVNGKPGWSAQFLIATLNARNTFTPLRWEKADKREGGSARAIATDRKTGEVLIGAWASMEMARKEGWLTKSGSKWQSMPEVMLGYRSASFFIRQFAPEVSLGLLTHEEVIDITDSRPENTRDSSLFKRENAKSPAQAITDSSVVEGGSK